MVSSSRVTSTGVRQGIRAVFTVVATFALLAAGLIAFAAPASATGSAPVANGDNFTVNEDTVLTGLVLANDSDPDGDALTASLAGSPTHGSVDLNADGSFSYTPDANFVGSDSFTYSVEDGNGNGSVADVNITVNPVNDAPTGSITITGQAIRGKTLSVSNNLNDADGLGTLSYQWKRNGVSVAGATTSNLVLSAPYVGTTVSVVVSYVDAGGMSETVASSNVGPVVEPGSMSGRVWADDDADGVADGSEGRAGVTVTLTWTDQSGAAASRTATTDATGNYVFADLDPGNYTVTATAPSGYTAPAPATLAVAAGPSPTSRDIRLTVDNSPPTNSAPTGSVTISGTPTQGQTLTADTSGISDADGLGPFTYQWKRDGVDIAGATTSTHTLGAESVGKTIRVVVHYTDGLGNAESLTSAPTAAVAESDTPITATCFGKRATQVVEIPADRRNDRVNGTNRADVIMIKSAPGASRQRVLVWGRGGNDLICAPGLNGATKVSGGAGNDRILGSSGNDWLIGDSGDDVIFGGAGTDRLSGRDGNDQLSGGAGNDRILGGNGDDVMSGQAGNDDLFGMNGDDVLSGGAGKDKLSGGAGNDRLTGNSGADQLFGGAGNDRLFADRIDTRVDGNSGINKIVFS